MTELAIRPAAQVQSFIPDAARGLVEWAQSASAAYDLAQRLVGTEFCPAQFKGKPDSLAAAMLAGAELGFDPMASMRAFDVIQGVAAPRAITLRAIVQNQGHDLVIESATPTKVIAKGRRKDSGAWQTVEWTIQRAQQLGLTAKDQWKKQPQTMLIARATSELARLIAADAILGIPYSAEELVDEQTETVTVTREAAPRARVQRKTAPKPQPEEPSFDEPADVTDAIELITDKQMKMMQALFSAKGFKDRDDRLAYVIEIVGIDVSSSKDLTKVQASQVIDALNQLDDPGAEPTLEDQ